MIHTVDTDIIIIAISLYPSLGTDHLWIDFGSGKNRCMIPIHDIVLNQIRRRGLRFFFCFTGCDQVSVFSHVSKKTAWKVWQVFPEINDVFAKLSEEPSDEVIRQTLPIIERFVILLYHRSSNCDSVNKCRRELFCKGRALDNLPPIHMIKSPIQFVYVCVCRNKEKKLRAFLGFVDFKLFAKSLRISKLNVFES